MMSRSSTIIESGSELLDPIHPGEVLLEDFLRPLGVSQNRLARDIAVPVSRVSAIVKGERAVTADTALRLGRYLGTSADVGWDCRWNTTFGLPTGPRAPRSRAGSLAV